MSKGRIIFAVVIILVILVIISLAYMSITKTGIYTSPFDGEWISKQDGNKFSIYTKDPTKCILTFVDGRKWAIILGETSDDGKSISYTQGTESYTYIFTIGDDGNTLIVQSGELNGVKKTLGVIHRQVTIETN